MLDANRQSVASKIRFYLAEKTVMSSIVAECFGSARDRASLEEASPELRSYIVQLAEGSARDQRCLWMELSEKPLELVQSLIPYVIRMIQCAAVSKSCLLDVMADYLEPGGSADHAARNERTLLLESIRELCLQGVPVYEECLASQDPEVRIEASRALGASRAPRVVPALLHQLDQETDLEVQEAILDAIGRLPAPTAVPPVMKLLQANCLAVQAKAAMACVRLSPAHYPAECTTVLSEAVLALPRNKFALSTESFKFLNDMGEDVVSAAVEYWCDRLMRASEQQATDFAKMLLIRLFPDKLHGTSEDDPVNRELLSEHQWRVLRAIAECTPLWRARERQIQESSESPHPGMRYSEPDLDWQLQCIGLSTDRELLLRIVRSHLGER
jgi:hypothetical protein